MRNYTFLLMTSAILAGTFASEAQTIEAETPDVTVIVGEKGSEEDVLVEFTENAPKRKADNGLPRFAIVGRDNQFYLGIGAQFLGEGVVDFGDAMPSVYAFVPSSITPREAGSGCSTRFTALTSSFYINGVALPGTKNRIGLFFKAEINNGGNDYGFHVSHFYVTYRGFTAGYTASMFQDGAAMPYTIDDQGPNGWPANTIFTAGYACKINPRWTVAVAVENPDADYTTGAQTKYVSQRIPAFPLYVQYGWGNNSHVRASALLRPLQYRNLNREKNGTVLGWGAQLSGVSNFSDKFSFYWNGVIGQGIANYVQDTEGLGLDMLPSYTSPGKMKGVKTFGVTGGLTYNFTEKLAMNAIYSHLTNWCADGTRAGGSTYRYGDYVACNLMYTLNKIVGMGIEYDYGHQKSFDGTGLHTNRIQAQLAVTF